MNSRVDSMKAIDSIRLILLLPYLSIIYPIIMPNIIEIALEMVSINPHENTSSPLIWV